jgi:hypothetical protein
MHVSFRHVRKECTVSRTRIRTTIVAGIATLALGAGVMAGLGPQASFASSHREAPLTAGDPKIVGVGALKARDAMAGRLSGTLARLVPVLSAGAIVAVGGFLTIRGLAKV